jgi:hypothetical protein
MAGLRPIYLNLPEEMSIDPLYELRAWRIAIETVEDFHRLITEHRCHPSAADVSEYRSAEDYCRNFFNILDPGKLEASIKHNTSGQARSSNSPRLLQPA